MDTKAYKLRVIVTACSMAVASASGIAIAQTSQQQSQQPQQQDRAQQMQPPPAQQNLNQLPLEPSPGSNQAQASESRDATQLVTEATEVVREMERDPDLMQALQQAQGIFIVPDYGRAAVGVGGRGGEGVVLVKQDGSWSNPAFYSFGGISAGVQAGIEAGSIAMILNNQKAVNSFRQDTNWSLNADAGLTVVAWSGRAQGNAGKGDVTVWSDAKGLFGDLAISVTGINFDEEATSAFYGRQVAMQEIFGGQVRNAPPQVAQLKQALPSGSGGAASGGSAAAAGGAAGAAGAAGAGVQQQGSAGGASQQNQSSSAAGTSGAGSTGSDAAAGDDITATNPPYTEDVEFAGQGTTGTGIGATGENKNAGGVD